MLLGWSGSGKERNSGENGIPWGSHCQSFVRAIINLLKGIKELKVPSSDIKLMTSPGSSHYKEMFLLSI